MLIAVTMGDPNGIGPEIALKAFAQGKFPKNGFLIGDLSVLQTCNQKLKLNVPLSSFELEAPKLTKCALNILNMNLMAEKDVKIGKITRKAGYAALQYIKKATSLALEKKVDAIVTLPVCKKSIMLSTPDFIGHTELIAKMCKVKDYTMMIASPKLITTYISTHVPLKECYKFVKKERILKVIEHTNWATKKLRGFAKIAVAALNPHAGERGAFGKEEITEIIPAIKKAQKMGINIYGPFSPDTIFFRALRGEFNAVVCMYHDQGHIPMKLFGVDEGVNVTLGLPIIRTSVDHGTAFDIAWQNKASISSFINACKMAQRLAKNI